jgi:hypothetical protein
VILVFSTAQCEAFDGDPTQYRERAVTRLYVERAVSQPTLAWPVTKCGTALCLNLDHLEWNAPRRIEYPEGVCVYCGVIAGTKDHLLPRTWTGDGQVRSNVVTVPACGDCNSSINDRYAPSVTERRELAHRTIRRKKKKVLAMPDWQKEDLAEMGRSMRDYIRKGLHEKALTKARLAWPEDEDYDLRAMQLSGIENPYEVGLLITKTEEEELAA